MGAATAPGPDGHSCREAGAETGRAAARSRGQRGLGPASPHGPGRRRPRGSGQATWALPSRGHRHRHWAYPELPARPTAVQGRGRAIPAGAADSACCARGAAVLGAAALEPAQPRRRLLPASREHPTHTRAPAAPRRLPAQCDVSASCRTMRPSPAPSAEKRSARPGTRRQAPGESAVAGPSWRTGEATAA